MYCKNAENAFVSCIATVGRLYGRGSHRILFKAHPLFVVSVPGGTMSADKWPRQYERVTPIEEVDPTDFVALTKARNQWVRDR